MTTHQLVVLGMHRSGTSVLTHLLHQMGCYVGADDDLMTADEANPAGYWEHNAVVALNREILWTIGASWCQRPNLERLDASQRARYLREARTIVASLNEHGTWVTKDPRMAILFPIWRQALHAPVCVMIWREPIVVARSLEARDGFPLSFGILLWELYVRTMLSETVGLSRLLVSYGQLVDQPAATVRHLHAQLLSVGVHLSLPSHHRVHAIVQRQLDRSSSRNPHDDYLLDTRHHDLVTALRDTSVLTWSSVPEMPPRAILELDAFSTQRKVSATNRLPAAADSHVTGGARRPPRVI